MKLIYTAISKQLFYFRMHISKFVLEKNAIPLNPFMLFEYFMLDSVERDKIREANKPIKYFKVINSKDIKEISEDEIEFEEGVENIFKTKI